MGAAWLRQHIDPLEDTETKENYCKHSFHEAFHFIPIYSHSIVEIQVTDVRALTPLIYSNVNH